MGNRKPYQLDGEVLKLVEGIRSRGYLEFRDLLKIGAWKAALPTPYLTTNEPDTIKTVTQQAIAYARQGDTYRAIEVLGNLDGMRGSLPMRSAVLAIAMYPDFPVIDKWTCKALGIELAGNDPQIYVAYFNQVKERAQREGCSVKKMDEHLMTEGMSRHKLSKE